MQNARTLLLTLTEELKIDLKQQNKSVQREALFPNAPNKIKVAIGMRRTGKTCFLFQQIRTLLSEGIPLSRILYINFEDDRLLPLNQKQFAALLDTFYSLYPENHEQTCYLFLDEIQNVEEWPLVVRRFFDTKPVELYLTGSSAKLLSKEIASSLRGRALSVEIWPYNFHEFMAAKAISIDTQIIGQSTLDKLQQVFMSYLEEGGFPEVTNYPAALRRQTLQEYVQVVTLRDIVERYRISNLKLMHYLIKTMINGAASGFSINKLYNDLKSQGFAVSKDTLHDYMGYIEDAYLVFTVPLFTESLRKSQTNPRKLYAIDTGLVKAYSLSLMANLGRMFENLVYLDLRRMGCEVYYYLTENRHEVDFLAIDPEGRQKLIQVAWDVTDEMTWQREERALETAMKELKVPGYIVTLERYLREGLGGF